MGEGGAVKTSLAFGLVALASCAGTVRDVADDTTAPSANNLCPLVGAWLIDHADAVKERAIGGLDTDVSWSLDDPTVSDCGNDIQTVDGSGTFDVIFAVVERDAYTEDVIMTVSVPYTCNATLYDQGWAIDRCDPS